MKASIVNCRIGSLENTFTTDDTGGNVNCRIGSLEIPIMLFTVLYHVNCRIGSLEIIFNYIIPCL